MSDQRQVKFPTDDSYYSLWYKDSDGMTTL